MIKLSGVTKNFGNLRAVDRLSFEVKKGEIVGLLGPNGAGKSTTMRMVAGYLAPDSGDVVVDDVDVMANPQVAQARIGYMPENNPLYKDMLVRELLDYGAGLRMIERGERKAAITFAIEATNIADVYNRPIGELSKGYKQRVGLAMALMHKPSVLILDEPTEGLDPNQRAEIRVLIKKLAKEHTIVISTHVMQEVEAMCSRILLINKGRLVADGSAAKLAKQANVGGRLVVELEGSGVVTTMKKLFLGRVEVVGENQKRVTFKIDNEGGEVQPALSKQIAEKKWVVWQVAKEQKRLEEVFSELTK
jgi:ABC-2 type transport system ATP-binding protein